MWLWRGHKREYWMINRGTRLTCRRMIWLLPYAPPPPLLSPSCLSFSVFQCVAGLANWQEWGMREWERSKIIQRRESLVLYNSFNSLWGTTTAEGGDYILVASCHAGKIRSLTNFWSHRYVHTRLAPFCRACVVRRTAYGNIRRRC